MSLRNPASSGKTPATMNGGLLAKFWVISGRVQGVGFRWFTARAADRIGIRGSVRNTRDGRVEVVGIGTSKQLEEFERLLRQGPNMSRVDNVENISKQLDIATFKSFEIN